MTDGEFSIDDNTPFEELCRRANGHSPRTDYTCVDTKTFGEKYNFFLNILYLTIVLGFIEWAFI